MAVSDFFSVIHITRCWRITAMKKLQIGKHTRSSNKEPERYKYLGLISWSTLEGQLNKDKYDDILKTFAKGVWLGLIIFIDD